MPPIIAMTHRTVLLSPPGSSHRRPKSFPATGLSHRYFRRLRREIGWTDWDELTDDYPIFRFLLFAGRMVATFYWIYHLAAMYYYYNPYNHNPHSLTAKVLFYELLNASCESWMMVIVTALLYFCFWKLYIYLILLDDFIYN